jgi:hypothetical protein
MAFTRDQLKQIVGKVTYKNWEFRVHEKGDGFLVQVVWAAPDAVTGVPSIQKARKWYVSSHACEGEVVRTCYKAIEAAEIHELQEQFKYCGQKIFDPHLHPEDLAILIAGEWLGQSVRPPRTAPNEFHAAARKALMKSVKLVTKKGNRPTKPRNGIKDERKR